MSKTSRTLCSIVALVSTLACNNPPPIPEPPYHPPKEYEVTPLGMKMITKGYQPNFEFFDRKFETVADCLEENRYIIDRDQKRSELFVSVLTDEDMFYCGAYGSREIEELDECRSLFYPSIPRFREAWIFTTEKGKAVAHEVDHYLSEEKDHDKLICGDRVDQMMNE